MKKKIVLFTSIICVLLIGTFFMYWQNNNNSKIKNKKSNNTSTISQNNSSNNSSSIIESNSNTNSDISSNSNTTTNISTNTNTTSNTNKPTNSNKPSNTNKPSNSNSNVTKPLTAAEKTEEALKKMTLDEKIGQMLIISVNGKSMTSSIKNAIKQYKPGGVILFASNLDDYQTTINFISDMKKNSTIPLIVAVDQEGGSVQRLSAITGKKATYIPAMQDVGKTEDENLAYSIGTVIAEELLSLGFNMDFAPVLDVKVSDAYISSRSFSTNPEIVSKMGISLSKGIESKGVIPVYKHFPGHGSTVTDSHYDLPLLSKTKAELYAVDLIPFQKAIQNNAKVIMIGHLAVPKVTKDNTPASLSKVLITDLLKKEMGYKGLVITDSLQMKGITNHYSEKQIYEMAINAGVDILLMPTSPKRAINNIKSSIKEGKIKESQINESVRKILMLKYTTLKEDKLSINYLGSKAHQQIVNKVK